MFFLAATIGTRIILCALVKPESSPKEDIFLMYFIKDLKIIPSELSSFDELVN